MTEERFIPKCNFQKCRFIAHIKDNENQVVLDINDIGDLLNEQQATINKLKEENEKVKKARDESDKFIIKKGLEIEFLEWCMK